MVEAMSPQSMGDFNTENQSEAIDHEVRREELELFFNSRVIKEHDVINHLKVTREGKDVWTDFTRCYAASHHEENLRKYSVKNMTVAYIPSKDVYCLIENTQENLSILFDLGFERGTFETFDQEGVIWEGDDVYTVNEHFHKVMKEMESN